MRKMKKILAMLLALVMVMGMTMTTMANGTLPSSGDEELITVTNVEVGATVTAYQIVEGDYDPIKGFLGYKAVSGVTLEDAEHPTAEEVGTIAQNVSGLTPIKLVANGTTYSKAVPVGYYVVLVTETASKQIYNPMLLGVYYTTADGTKIELNGGSVDAGTEWNLNGETGYAKKQEPVVVKEIVESSSGKNKGDHVAIGDEVKFKITTDIPTYSKEYTEVTYQIVDTLGEGLTNKKDVTVKVGTTDLLTEGNATVAYSENDSVTTITVDSDYILENGGNQVVVEYSAVLNGNAGTNFDPNENNVSFFYTNNPDVNVEPAEKTDKTYHYTFEIDGTLFGDESIITKELTKVGEIINEETGEREPLAGAEFTLTRGDGKVYTTTSNEDGELNFKGLDVGTYKLKETKAPNGYSINTKEVSVVIDATFSEDGQLEDYSIIVDGKCTSTYTPDLKTKKTVYNDKNVSTGSDNYDFVNTKLINLPSTGGIGTTIFTVAGCGIMIAAAFFFFASRKKEN